MKKLTFLFALSILLSLCASVKAQRILAFDKRGKVKRIKYYEGNFIKLKLITNETLLGDITQIADSSFKIGNRKITLDSVKLVFNTRKLYGFKLLGRILLTGGTLYMGIDSFNRLINDEGPIFHESTIKASSLMLGGGVVSLLIARRPYRISKKRPLKILDLTI